MPTVAWVVGYAIAFFYADPDPPHFHVIGKGVEAKVSLSDLQIVEVTGSLSRSDIRAIRDWARANLPALHENWTLARRHEALRRIGD